MQSEARLDEPGVADESRADVLKMTGDIGERDLRRSPHVERQ